jgi:uracil-DNA glycosylase
VVRSEGGGRSLEATGRERAEQGSGALALSPREAGARLRPMDDSRPERLAALNDDVTGCRACPRLVEWREEVARTKRAAFADEEYWGRPVPSFGDPRARILVVGLAPAAHGANRTGRMFTGDRSGNWLYRALHRAGFANQPEAEHRDDGLVLTDCWITAGVRCAPPANRPTPQERRNCRPFLERELEILLPGLRGVVALGSFAFDHVLRIFRDGDFQVPSPKPRFGHGVEVEILRPMGGGSLRLLGSYHPSQQNTFTGTLTEEAFDGIWARSRELVEAG